MHSQASPWEDEETKSITDIKNISTKESKIVYTSNILKSDKERKKVILTSTKRPKFSIRPNKRLILKCCLIFGNNKPK